MIAFIARNPLLAIGGTMVLFLVLVAAFYEAVTPYALTDMNMMNRFALPSAEHWMGTDNFGRDLATRLAAGARYSILIALVAVTIAAVIGTTLGVVAGYMGGWVDLVLMRVVDIFLAFPGFVLALAIIGALGPGPTNLTIALAAVAWTQFARVARSVTVSERERDYIAAATVIGASTPRILFRHLLPNMMGPLVVIFTLGIGTAIINESGMSFLGLGVQPPTPTWGWALSYGLQYLRSDPWMSTAAGLSIMFAVMAFNLLGDGLRDLLDPNQLAGRGPQKSGS